MKKLLLLCLFLVGCSDSDNLSIKVSLDVAEARCKTVANKIGVKYRMSDDVHERTINDKEVMEVVYSCYLLDDNSKIAFVLAGEQLYGAARAVLMKEAVKLWPQLDKCKKENKCDTFNSSNAVRSCYRSCADLVGYPIDL